MGKNPSNPKLELEQEETGAIDNNSVKYEDTYFWWCHLKKKTKTGGWSVSPCNETHAEGYIIDRQNRHIIVSFMQINLKLALD